MNINIFEGKAVKKEISAIKEQMKANPEETKALDTIDSDKRLKKAYNSWKGKMDSEGKDMQKKYLEAVMKYGENVGGYNKQTENWEMATFSSVPEMGGGGAKRKEAISDKSDAKAEVAYAEKMSAARKFFETAPGAWSDVFERLTSPGKEAFLKEFVEDPKSKNKRFAYDEKKKEYVYKESYAVEL